MLFPSWLHASRARIQALVERDKVPQALLIHGPIGTGRRLLALSIIGRLLNLENVDFAAGVAGLRIDPELAPGHPDLCIVQPPPEKRMIPIESIRELIGSLNLTSHQQGYKVAVVNPAQALTHPAANSLLKTLEEPPGRAVIILITDSLSRIPATIVSRSHRIRVAVPAADVALDWLNAQNEGNADWPTVLKVAAGSPLLALQYHAAGVPELIAGFERDIDALQARHRSPAEVARNWAKSDPDVYLTWLYQRIGSEIVSASVGGTANQVAKTGNHRLQSGLENLNFERAFADLTYIGELRRLQGGGLNAELQIAGVLTRWVGTSGAA
jgi:DNA polymerase-3 subunit delta'